MICHDFLITKHQINHYNDLGKVSTLTTTSKVAVGAINEINTALSALEDRGTIEVIADGTKTISTLLDEIRELTDADKLEVGISYIIIDSVNYICLTKDSSRNATFTRAYYSYTNQNVKFGTVLTKASDSKFVECIISNGSFTENDMSSNVLPSGRKVKIHY